MNSSASVTFNTLLRMCGRFRSLVYLPTNRECKKAINSYADEVRWATQNGHPSLLCVIESKDDADVRLNGDALANVRDQGTFVLHFTRALQKQFLQHLFNVSSLTIQQKELVEECLFPKVSCYSSNPNKAALLSRFLGAKILHRRDSDTFVCGQGKECYPIRAEISTVSSILGDVCEATGGVAAGKTIVASGTGYLGDESLDRRLFQKFAPDLLLEHERINAPSSNEDALLEKVNYKYNWDNAQDPRTIGLPAYTHDVQGFAEMGCIAFDVEFGLVPELPLPGCLSTEHFHKNLLYRFQAPVLYHNTLVGHGSTARETLNMDVGDYVSYAMKDAAFKVMRLPQRQMNTEIIRRLTDSIQPENFSSFLKVDYADCIGHAIMRSQELSLLPVVKQTAEIYLKAAEVAQATPQAARFMKSAGDAIWSGSETICQHVLGGFERYERLARCWCDLMSAALIVSSKAKS